MPHPTLFSTRRRDSHLLRSAWHTPVPVSDGLMDANVSDSCVKPHHLGQFPSSALLPRYRKTRESCMGEKKHLESQGFTRRRRIFLIAPEGQDSALLIQS